MDFAIPFVQMITVGESCWGKRVMSQLQTYLIQDDYPFFELTFPWFLNFIVQKLSFKYL